MSKTRSTWRGAVSVGSGIPCDECGQCAAALFQIAHAPLNTDSIGRWACRACVLDSARGIGVVDRRGDILRTPERIARELDLRTAIALHLDARERASRPEIDWGPTPESPPFPADYVQVLAVLRRLSRADDESGEAIAELRERYEAAACFSPKQMLLIQWRLAKHGIEHEPSRFAVSVRSDKEIAQIRSFDDWRKKKIAPYLSWEQRSKFGF